MLVLVLGANFPVMFVGWEGVGLCSYLLIGFWFKKKSAADAGKKAFIVNRIGDFGFILGMLLVFAMFGTLDFQAVAAAADGRAVEHGVMGGMTVATLLLFLGATGKSAQIPLYVWLPDAMEGPTPVSALIHAATMVTAGVYMIGRNAVLFSHAPTTLVVVAGIGAATALLAGTIGLVQNDIKRVLAYSTVSQLGYMFLAMGVGAYAAGIFHLYTHAFFKALLFLGSGAVIHALAGEQDLRKMGGLKKDLPITYWTFLIGALAIAGVPLLAGFFSKDEILYRTFTSTNPNRLLLWGIGMVTSLLTATYMFRLVFLAFHGTRHAADPHAAAHSKGAHGHAGHHLHDAPPSMAIPLIVLAIGSIGAGYVGVPHALGGSNRIELFLEPSFEVAESARNLQTTGAAVRPVDAGAVRPASLQETQPAQASGRRQESTAKTGTDADGALERRRVRRHRHCRLFLAAQPRGCRRSVAQHVRPVSAALQQVLRGRALRCRHRPADQVVLDRGALEGRGRRSRGRRRQRRGPGGAGRQRHAQAGADRVGEDVRGRADPWCRRDSRVLFVAMTADVLRDTPFHPV